MDQFSKFLKNLGIGIVSAVFTQPFQMLRTSAIRSQMADNRVGFSSLYHLLSRILKKEGLPGLFRGTTYAMAKNGISAVVFFQSMCQISPKIKKFVGLEQQDRGFKNPLYFLEGVMVAGTSKVITVFSIIPILVLKTNVEIAGSQSRGLTLVKEIYHKKGVAGFFRGFVLTLLRDVPWSGLQFSFYRTILKVRQSLDSSEKSNSFIFASGAISSLAATLIVYPFDNIRVRMQTANENVGFWKILGSTVSQEGVGGLYKGVEPRLLKKALTGGLLWTSYKIVWKKDEIQI